MVGFGQPLLGDVGAERLSACLSPLRALSNCNTVSEVRGDPCRAVKSNHAGHDGFSETSAKLLNRRRLAGIVDRPVAVVVWLFREAKGICLDTLSDYHFGDALMLLACEAG